MDVSYETGACRVNNLNDSAPRDPYALQSSVTYPTEAPVEDSEPASAPQCNSVIVAGGTIDGYLYIWRFDWDVMCRTAGAKDDFSPFFSQMIPIFVDPQDDEPSHRIVSLHFLPSPQSYLLAIALYMGTVVTWDIRNGTLEGEINAYYTVNRPVTIARWTENKQFIIIGGPSVMCVEWASKVGMTALSYDRVSRVACSGSCDNICWSVDSSANFVYLVYDDGLFVQAPVVALTKRNVQDVVTSYLWEPFVKEDEPVASVADVDTQDPMAAAQELAELQFKMDMNSIRTHGVCVTRNGSRFRGARKGKVESDRVIRNKVYSHHCVKARSVLFSEFRLSFMAYGGHTGLLHVIIKHS
ncbi:hypothetical protein, conserved [Babesia bigemina]|uniref:Uncharacterized protein n=1 Tax=Babesia bigemina TaxID=5866 RepID=A0A061DD24_BABBI|nr:LOW QUALITY PROTEIN: hypothetical protein, conserved [Babesia bigemina]CDR95885.1 hypothetical protein, conserved [Babesia bigemina]|eukprot:XP_012768071.1 LOW QUALITY PROTEIN: hypothetical protein, conserved [Babesia bigemina]